MHDDTDESDIDPAPHQKRDIVLLLALGVATLFVAKEWHEAPGGLAGVPATASSGFMYQQSASGTPTRDLSMAREPSEIPVPRARPDDLPSSVAAVDVDSSYR